MELFLNYKEKFIWGQNRLANSWISECTLLLRLRDMNGIDAYITLFETLAMINSGEIFTWTDF